MDGLIAGKPVPTGGVSASSPIKKSAAILAALFFYQSVVFSSYPSITSHNASSSASLNKPAG
jgi:preprotein translocase subunit SecG